jgi:CheY-like chemotaxis protein
MITRGGEPIKILLADDDVDDREFFENALKEAEATAKFKTVGDGEKLMEYLAEVDGQHPDIIFLDINMSRKNGRSTCGNVYHFCQSPGH